MTAATRPLRRAGPRSLQHRTRGLPWQPFVSLAIAALLWEYVLPVIADSDVIPSIGEIAEEWVAIWPTLVPAIITTLQSFAVGMALSVVAGVLVAVAAYYSPTFDYLIQPYMTLFMSVPVIALVPVLMLVLGLGFETRVAVVFMFAFFIIEINIESGLRSVNPTHLELARAFSANGRQQFLMIVFPSSLPWLATGLRLGVARALKGTINAELVIRSAGLGYLLLRYTEQLNLAATMAIAATCCLLVMAVMQTVTRAERRLLRWSA